jgi:hypothetical protein
VYRRADLWRTVARVVALLLTAVSTGVFVREFRAAGPQNNRHQIVVSRSRRLAAEKDPLENFKAGAIDLNRTIVALIRTMPPVLIARFRGVDRI